MAVQGKVVPGPNNPDPRRVIATILVRARDNAAKCLREAWDDGASGWSVGTLAYEFSVRAIERAGASGRFPWLSVVRHGMELVFSVEGVAYKFFKGDFEGTASSRHAEPTIFEEATWDLLSVLEDRPREGVNRFIVEATAKGFPGAVACAFVTKDGTQHDITPLALLPMSFVDVAFESSVRPMAATEAETLDAPDLKRRDEKIKDDSEGEDDNRKEA